MENDHTGDEDNSGHLAETNPGLFMYSFVAHEEGINRWVSITKVQSEARVA